MRIFREPGRTLLSLTLTNKGKGAEGKGHFAIRRILSKDSRQRVSNKEEHFPGRVGSCIKVMTILPSLCPRTTDTDDDISRAWAFESYNKNNNKDILMMMILCSRRITGQTTLSGTSRSTTPGAATILCTRVSGASSLIWIIQGHSIPFPFLFSSRALSTCYNNWRLLLSTHHRPNKTNIICSNFSRFLSSTL